MMKDKQQKSELVKEQTIQVTFNCPESIQYELRRIAIKEDRNLSKQVAHALREWLRDRGRADG